MLKSHILYYYHETIIISDILQLCQYWEQCAVIAGAFWWFVLLPAAQCQSLLCEGRNSEICSNNTNTEVGVSWSLLWQNNKRREVPTAYHSLGVSASKLWGTVVYCFVLLVRWYCCQSWVKIIIIQSSFKCSEMSMNEFSQAWNNNLKGQYSLVFSLVPSNIIFSKEFL